MLEGDLLAFMEIATSERKSEGNVNVVYMILESSEEMHYLGKPIDTIVTTRVTHRRAGLYLLALNELVHRLCRYRRGESAQ